MLHTTFILLPKVFHRQLTGNRFWDAKQHMTTIFNKAPVSQLVVLWYKDSVRYRIPTTGYGFSPQGKMITFNGKVVEVVLSDGYTQYFTPNEFAHYYRPTSAVAAAHGEVQGFAIIGSPIEASAQWSDVTRCWNLIVDGEIKEGLSQEEFESQCHVVDVKALDEDDLLSIQEVTHEIMHRILMPFYRDDYPG